MKNILWMLVLLLSYPAAAWQGKRQPVAAPPDSTTLKQFKNIHIGPALLPAVPYNYYQELGAACKVEFRLEKATGVPFRFRLGSLQQTDYLERKPNAVKPER